MDVKHNGTYVVRDASTYFTLHSKRLAVLTRPPDLTTLVLCYHVADDVCCVFCIVCLWYPHAGEVCAGFRVHPPITCPSVADRDCAASTHAISTHDLGQPCRCDARTASRRQVLLQASFFSCSTPRRGWIGSFSTSQAESFKTSIF